MCALRCDLAGCSLIAGLAMLVWPAVAAEPDWSSWSAFPGDGHVAKESRNVHDPTIVHLGGRYFCFSTAGNGFGELRASDDLDDWRAYGPVMPETPQWLREKIPKHRSLWAPDVIAMPGGRVRMYYSASQVFGKNTSYIGVAECEKFDPQRPNENWRDLGLVIASETSKDTFNAIDPDVIFDESGRLWMFFGSYYAGLYIVELDPETGKLKNAGDPEMTLIARNTGSQNNALEAPVVIKRGDYYYLFVSYGLAAQGVRSDYHIVMGRSQAITGPYVDIAGKPMLDGGHAVLLNSSSPMFAPGHCDVFQDANGRELLAYHYYDARHFWVDGKWGLPTLQVRELLWTDDGWPLPGMPVKLAGKPFSGKPRVAGRWVHQPDFSEPQQINYEADGTIRGGRRPGKWSLQNGKLVLQWTNEENANRPFVDTVQFSADGDYYAGRNQRGIIIRGHRVKTQEEGGR